MAGITGESRNQSSFKTLTFLTSNIEIEIISLREILFQNNFFIVFYILLLYSLFVYLNLKFYCRKQKAEFLKKLKEEI